MEKCGVETAVEEMMQDSSKGSRVQGRGTGIHNQVVIQNGSGGLIHIGPTYNLNMVAQVNHQAAQERGDTMEKDDDKGKPSIESVRPLWYSTRVMEADEMLRLSKNISASWKAVGNGLKFNWSQIEQFEADTRSQGEAVHRMLFRWLQWKDQKATVGRLTKVLFNHHEYEAINCLQP